MIHAGDSIENPVTGERLVFRQTSRETGGEAVVVETFVKPNGFVAAAHVHPDQEERFEVCAARRLQGRPRQARRRPGRRIKVPAGTPSGSGTPARCRALVCKIRPALRLSR